MLMLSRRPLVMLAVALRNERADGHAFPSFPLNPLTALSLIYSLVYFIVTLFPGFFRPGNKF